MDDTSPPIYHAQPKLKYGISKLATFIARNRVSVISYKFVLISRWR